MSDPLVSILTPTWNRSRTLPALRASLEAQSSKAFEWLVVDDGSTDETPALLDSWKGQTSFPFRAFRTANGGKHRALNRGIPEARGEAVFVVDSDDELPARSIERIMEQWTIVAPDHNLVGLAGYRAHRDGRRIGCEFPRERKMASSLELVWGFGCRGDRAEVFRRSVLLSNPFPEFDDENFLTEAVVWNRIARQGVLLLVPEVLYMCDYLEDGLSARSLELRVRNPRGSLLYYRELAASPVPILARLRAVANYLRILALSSTAR